MARKRYRQLTAQTLDQAVELSFYARRDHGESLADIAALPVRIYRKEEPNFVWGDDYLEWFDGLDSHQAAVIFDGLLPPTCGVHRRYVDTTAQVGRTYAYWAGQGDEHPPSGPVPVRLYDRRVWWPQAETERRMDELAARHGDRVRLQLFGHTVLGRPLRALIAGRGKSSVAVVGTFHAGESGPELLLPTAARLLQERPDLLDRIALAILPSVNIDSREQMVDGHPVYLRQNLRGVDLNRNCPARWEEVALGYGLRSDEPTSQTWRGPAPASEPEIQATLAFLRHVRPRAVFSYHWLASICGTGMLSPIDDSSADYAAEARRVADIFAAGFHGQGDRDADLRPSTTPGSLELWVRQELQVPVFCVEWPDERYNMDENVQSKRGETTFELLCDYQQRHYRALSAVLESLGR